MKQNKPTFRNYLDVGFFKYIGLMATGNNLGNLAFNGKSLLITGGDTGIGAATAKLAAQRGARIFIASLNEETLQKTADEINASGGECRWIVCDVRHQDQVERAVQATVDAYGSLDLAYTMRCCSRTHIYA
jgi:enoyl-[acyl-carrier-protein] reductase (NADH)